MSLLLAAAILLQQPVRTPAAPAAVMMPPLPTQRFVDDMRDKKLEDILALFMPHAAFIDPTGKSFATADARRTLFAQAFATYDSDLSLHDTGGALGGDPTQAGTLAIETGDYSETLRTRATGISQQMCGGYSFFWERQPDGAWLLTRMQWTSTPCLTAKPKPQAAP